VMLTNLPCPSCKTLLLASDECKTTYPGIHYSECPCGWKGTIRCARNHEPEDFFLTAGEAIEHDDKHRKEK
jgi:hypothetical protein